METTNLNLNLNLNLKNLNKNKQVLASEYAKLKKKYELSNLKLMAGIMDSETEQENSQIESALSTIETMFELEHFDTYNFIRAFAEEKGYKGVLDIGCAEGYQAQMFADSGIDYAGLNDSPNSQKFWLEDKYTYICGRYPCDVPESVQSYLPVSVLCIGYACYGDTDEHDRILDRLSSDFPYALIEVKTEESRDEMEAEKELFGKHFIIEDIPVSDHWRFFWLRSRRWQ